MNFEIIQSSFCKATEMVKIKSPVILAVTGVISITASVITACKATVKAEPIFKKLEEDRKGIEEAKKNHPTEYTKDKIAHDKTIVYGRTIVKAAKVYWLPAVLLIAGLASILCSNYILSNRLAQATAACAAVTEAFKHYRSQITKKFGEEIDAKARRGILVENEDGNDDNGNTDSKENNKKDDILRIFDETCSLWKPNAEINYSTIMCIQNTANDMLRAKHILFLNDVFEMFDFPRTAAGQTLGWVYDPKKDAPNKIDFGVFDRKDPAKRLFVNGKERSIWLDFNVDGPVDYLLEGGKY